MKRYAVIRTDFQNAVIDFAATIDEGHQVCDWTIAIAFPLRDHRTGER